MTFRTADSDLATMKAYEWTVQLATVKARGLWVVYRDRGLILAK